MRKVKQAVRKPKKVLVRRKKTPARKSVAKRPAPKRRSGAEQKTESSFDAQSFFKAKIKVIGIGGGGGSIVSEIGRSLGKATFVVADTDVRAFKKRAGIKYFLFGQQLTHGLGTGLNTDLARQAAEQEKEKIAKLFKDQDIVIFIAALGGGLGSAATQVFAEAARDFGGISFGIFTLPFKFEGKNKYKIASRALRELRKSLNVSITIPNERIFKIIDSNTAITDAFSMVNKSLIESLESLIDLIYSPGVINIDFADLRAILNGLGNLAFLNTAEASGKDRAEKIIHEILHNPLYQYNNFIAQKVLFNIAGGGNLSMFEVDKISRAISEQNPKAKIIFGISKNAKYKNKIKTTLLMTGPASIAEVAPAGQQEESAPDAVVKKNPASAPRPAKKVRRKTVAKPASKPAKQKKQNKKPARKASPVRVPVIPVFTPAPTSAEPSVALAVAQQDALDKKAIRRTALEVKKAEELQAEEKSQQEKEWEIPAFLRLKK